MPNLTIFIPNVIYEKMQDYKDMNWPSIIRAMIEQQLREIENTEYHQYSYSQLIGEERAEELFDFE